MVVGGIGIAVAMIFGDPQPAPTQPPSAPARAPKVPTPFEFSIGVVVTEQNCPPSGSCVYKYTIEPKYFGQHPLPDKPFTVEYVVRGGHQPQPGKFTVHKQQAEIMKDVVVEGPPGARLQAAVTQIVG